jgi:hypothetical protein
MSQHPAARTRERIGRRIPLKPTRRTSFGVALISDRPERVSHKSPQGMVLGSVPRPHMTPLSRRERARVRVRACARQTHSSVRVKARARRPQANASRLPLPPGEGRGEGPAHATTITPRARLASMFSEAHPSDVCYTPSPAGPALILPKGKGRDRLRFSVATDN